jgi:hypothetical protein
VVPVLEIPVGFKPAWASFLFLWRPLFDAWGLRGLLFRLGSEILFELNLALLFFFSKND